ncbi:hypothetical protein [Streptomyces sp. NPDC101166]|uniref:hypothetical protein n=1 Tax=Streptomyces sp. NPDC101166 TaxID=3366120 RepID=UPI0037FC171E
MRINTRSTVKPATRRAATVALVALAALAAAPSATAAEDSPAGGAISATTEIGETVANLLGPLGHTWGN